MDISLPFPALCQLSMQHYLIHPYRPLRWELCRWWWLRGEKNSSKAETKSQEGAKILQACCTREKGNCILQQYKRIGYHNYASGKLDPTPQSQIDHYKTFCGFESLLLQVCICSVDLQLCWLLVLNHSTGKVCCLRGHGFRFRRRQAFGHACVRHQVMSTKMAWSEPQEHFQSCWGNKEWMRFGLWR